MEAPDGEAPDASLPSVAVEVITPGVAVAALLGEHDLSTGADVETALARAGEQPMVLVDLTGCTFIDSTTIGLLISAYKAQSKRPGGRLELVVPALARNVHGVVRLAALDTVIRTHETRSAGLESLRDGA
jgi:anti-anti-sigma factor